MPKTIIDKIWDDHLVYSHEGEPDLLFVDLHLIHEITTAQAFDGLRLNGRTVRHPELPLGTTPKDLILGIIRKIGVGGGVGHAIEFCGDTFRQMSMEGRMTVCNMTIEGGGRAGLVAPDDTTFAYLEGRPYAPKGANWEKALDYWRSLATDSDAKFDKEVSIDTPNEIVPFVTWGTNPGQSVPVTDRVPDPAGF